MGVLPASRVYRRLFVAQVVALLGTGVATVALGLLAYALAGPRAGEVLGTALAIKMVAYVVVSPLVGAVADRVPRRALMVAADVVRIGVVVALPWVGAVWQVYLMVAVLQAASATFTPTFQSVLPDLLPADEDYTAALSASQIAVSLENNEAFFLSECRFRRAICLKALGHVEEFRRIKAEISVGTSILLDDGSHHIEDL